MTGVESGRVLPGLERVGVPSWLPDWCDGAATEGALCAGYNGLGLALSRVMGTDLLWYSEIEPAPSEVMAARYPGVPNLGDLTALNWEDVPPVDVMTAGYPCQPFQPRREAQGAGR